MKFNTPLPQTLPKECTKAAKICHSSGCIRRTLRDLPIFTVFKAGFLFSARAGTGIVIAKLDDGSWSAPSAIGSAGLGVGGQLGAEMTDFLIILNSTSRSFMSAGNLTLGGNVSVAVGPLGRNGEAIGSLNSSGKVAAMYSYSKTRGLFGGVSIEGSVIVERQDANTLAYKQDVTAKMLLNGAVPCPEWASSLVKTLESCTGLPGTRKWVDDGTREQSGYAFASPKSEGSTPSFLNRKKKGVDFPPEHWGKKRESGSYFTSGGADTDVGPNPWDDYDRAPQSGSGFDTKFESNPTPPSQSHRRPFNSVSAPPGVKDQYDPASPFNSLPPFSSAHSGLSDKNGAHSRSMSVPFVKQSSNRHSLADYTNPFASSSPLDDNFFESDNRTSYPAAPFIKTKAEFASSIAPGEGVSRAIALYDFNAVEAGDLSFSKGDVIIITKKSESTDDWWTGKSGGKEGIFPANFVETV
ncbi:hypothetical protein EDB19DRAFT_1891609 [Suillus lakei]|nr:hypothetical protein EDB19DRAFT_1891609 [Suillus lakei]